MVQRINNMTINNPTTMRKLLEAMDAEVDLIRTLIIELQTDHATFKSAVDSQKAVLSNICLSSAGLAIGTVSKKAIKIVNPTYYTISGAIYVKTSEEIDFTATEHDVPQGNFAFFVVSVAANGTVTITKGEDGANITTITPPETDSIIGYVVIAAIGGPFDATSDDLDAAHLTVIYMNASFLPHLISNAPETLSSETVVEKVKHGV